MSGLPLPEPVADEDDDGLQDRAALLTPARPRPGRRRPRARPHSAAGRCLPLIKTLTICLAFFTLGLCVALPGPTLLDLQDQVAVSQAQISQIFFWRALGYLAGSMISGLLFDKLNRLLMMLASMALAAAGMATVPWLSSALSLNVCFAALGVPLGFVDTGGNVLLLDLWGKSSGPYMQAIHFSFGLGAFAAPLLAVPFIAHAPALNGTATALFGRNHLHTVRLPADPPARPGHLPTAQVLDFVTRPPAVTRRSSVQRGDYGADPAQFTKLGVVLAGGDAAARYPRSAQQPEEARTHVTGRKGVLSDGGRAGDGETTVRREGTQPPVGEATELAMGGDSDGATVLLSADGGLEVTVAPSRALVENSSGITAPIDDAAATDDSTVSNPVEEGPPAIKVVLSETHAPETKVTLPSNVTDLSELPRDGQNASEEAMYDVTTSGNFNFTDWPPDGITAGSAANASEPTSELALQHTPKPKPVFTDGNKLEHDQTWARPPLKPALHPAPVAPPDPAEGSSADGAASAPPDAAQPTGSPPAAGGGLQNDSTPASAAGSETAGGGDVEATTGGGQPRNGTAAGSTAQSESASGGSNDTSVAAPASAASKGASETASAAERPESHADEAHTATTRPGDGPLTTVFESSPDGNHMDDGHDSTPAAKSRVTSEPGPMTSPVSKSAHGAPLGAEPASGGPELPESPPAEQVVTSSDPSLPAAVSDSPGDDDSLAAVEAADSSDQKTATAAATDTPEPEPNPAELRPAPALGAGTEAADGADAEDLGWDSGADSEAAAGTEPGLRVPAVPPTAAVPATQPGIVGAAPSPTASQGAAAPSPTASQGAAAPSPTASQGAAAPSPTTSQGTAASVPEPTTSQAAAASVPEPTGVWSRTQPAAGRPPASAAGPAGSSTGPPPQPADAAASVPAAPSSESPPPPPPRPHKPGTYDDTSAEDGLLTRLSSAAAVRGVPPLAQLYLLVSCSLLLVALVFLALLVYDPRARRAAPASDTGAGPSRCYKAALVSLMAVVLCFYVGMEVAMGQLLMSFSVHSKVHLTRAGGAYVTSVFWGLFAAGRALSVCVAGVLRPAAVLAIDYVLVTAGAAVLLAAGSWDRTSLLLGGALSGLGMASVFPAALVWLEQHVHVSSRLAAVLVVAGALGEMLLPAGVGALMAHEPRALIYSLAVCTGVCLLTQAAAVVTARLGRPAVGPLQGYQLAAQEEEDDMVDLAKYPGSGEEGGRRLLRM